MNRVSNFPSKNKITLKKSIEKPFRYFLVLCAALVFVSCGQDLSKSEEQSKHETSEEEELRSLYSEIEATTPEVGSVPKYSDTKNILKSGQTIKQLTTLEPKCSFPTLIKDLRAGVTFKLYKFDQSQSATASAMGYGGSIGKKEMLLIQDFVRHDFVDCDGAETKIGIGLRCYIHVTSFKGKLNAATPAGIAASVELDRAKCTYELKSLGFPIDGRVLADGLQPQGDYNVENFGKLAVTFNNVLGLLNDDNTMIIRPVKLP